MKEVDVSSFESNVLKSENPVLVDFGAAWCAPCRALKPVLEAYSKERTDVEFVFIDTDDNGDIAEKYNVMTLPSLLLFKDGSVVGRMSGNAPKEKIADFLNTNLV